MRIPIAIMLAAAVAVSPMPALAQENEVAATADAANLAATAPEDANAVVAEGNIGVTEAAPSDDTAMAEDAAAMPAPAPASRPFPWGVLGLIGLAGLLGRQRS